jgi:hypothetical protein
LIRKIPFLEVLESTNPFIIEIGLPSSNTMVMTKLAQNPVIFYILKISLNLENTIITILITQIFKNYNIIAKRPLVGF